MADNDGGLKSVERAKTLAWKIAVALVVILAGLTLIAFMLRGNSDPTFWKGFVSLWFGIIVPAGLFIGANDSLETAAKQGTPVLSDKAPVYLWALIAICLLIVVPIAYYCFATTTRPVTDGQVERILYPFGEGVDGVKTIISPFFAMLLSYEFFKAAKAIEKSSRAK